jgi:hypothetical protein
MRVVRRGGPVGSSRPADAATSSTTTAGAANAARHESQATANPPSSTPAVAPRLASGPQAAVARVRRRGSG